MDVEELYKRANDGGKKNPLSVADCAFLKQHEDPAKPFPPYCDGLLRAATKRGLLARRNSRVAETWKIGEHGINRLSTTEPVAGGAADVANPAAPSVNDYYMSTQSPEAQEKIRRLQVRAASRGARPRVDYKAWTSKPENQAEVHQEVHTELVRRESRRKQPNSGAPLGLVRRPTRPTNAGIGLSVSPSSYA